MTKLRGLSGTTYSLGNSLANGGEGTIYSISGDKIAKIYHDSVLSDRGASLRSKISYMYEHPPNDSVLTCLAWPIDVLFDSKGKFIGFLMNRLKGFSEFTDVYSYIPADPKPQDLMSLIALNLCALTDSVHSAGYVIGDFNPANIGFKPLGNKHAGQVCLFDNDSFQFSANGQTFKCEVQCPEYVAPEVQDEIDSMKRECLRNNRDPSSIKVSDLRKGWSVDTDNFALAEHIFKLLFNAYNPYDSKNAGSSQSKSHFTYGKQPSSRVAVPSLNECIQNRWYMFDKGKEPFGKHVPPKNSFPPYIMDLFRRAFSKDCAGVPRPTAFDWYHALSRYSEDIKRCSVVKSHIFWKGSDKCPYCIASGLNGVPDKKPKVTIKFEGNISSGVTKICDDEGRMITLPSAGQLPGFIFVGWKSPNGKLYEPGKRMKLTKDITMKAFWIHAKVELTLHIKFIFEKESKLAKVPLLKNLVHKDMFMEVGYLPADGSKYVRCDSFSFFEVDTYPNYTKKVTIPSIIERLAVSVETDRRNPASSTCVYAYNYIGSDKDNLRVNVYIYKDGSVNTEISEHSSTYWYRCFQHSLMLSTKEVKFHEFHFYEIKKHEHNFKCSIIPIVVLSVL